MKKLIAIVCAVVQIGFVLPVLSHAANDISDGLANLSQSPIFQNVSELSTDSPSDFTPLATANPANSSTTGILENFEYDQAFDMDEGCAYIAYLVPESDYTGCYPTEWYVDPTYGPMYPLTDGCCGYYTFANDTLHMEKLGNDDGVFFGQFFNGGNRYYDGTQVYDFNLRWNGLTNFEFFFRNGYTGTSICDFSTDNDSLILTYGTTETQDLGDLAGTAHIVVYSDNYNKQFKLKINDSFVTNAEDDSEYFDYYSTSNDKEYGQVGEFQIVIPADSGTGYVELDYMTVYASEAVYDAYIQSQESDMWYSNNYSSKELPKGCSVQNIAKKDDGGATYEYSFTGNALRFDKVNSVDDSTLYQRLTPTGFDLCEDEVVEVGLNLINSPSFNLRLYNLDEESEAVACMKVQNDELVIEHGNGLTKTVPITNGPLNISIFTGGEYEVFSLSINDAPIFADDDETEEYFDYKGDATSTFDSIGITLLSDGTAGSAVELDYINIYKYYFQYIAARDNVAQILDKGLIKNGDEDSVGYFYTVGLRMLNSASDLTITVAANSEDKDYTIGSLPEIEGRCNLQYLILADGYTSVPTLKSVWNETTTYNVQ